MAGAGVRQRYSHVSGLTKGESGEEVQQGYLNSMEKTNKRPTFWGEAGREVENEVIVWNRELEVCLGG
jgi:hypothetical protein